ncbi:hypothetical protein [Streptomyces sp. HUAS TT20]|uniref:hypothetical protein n=1 Tax=Streptomyces sp. HUAS TT20 TaxID=3447509 RepID=UPI0021DA5924|nr:hypothetical protein [Streptomyces sp. HUAS 15-9]UXY25468.1 hypothetical protein N8I87_02060 [Streptomyces sp. HUAS 15-9]
MNITIHGSVDNTIWAINNRDVTQTQTQAQAQTDFKSEIEEAASKFREELMADRDAFLRANFPGWERRTGVPEAHVQSANYQFASSPTAQQIKAACQAVRSAMATLEAELPEMQLGSTAEDEIRRTVAAINHELGCTSPDRARIGAALDGIIAVLHGSRYPQDSPAGRKTSAAVEQLKSARLQLDTLDVA